MADRWLSQRLLCRVFRALVALFVGCSVSLAGWDSADAHTAELAQNLESSRRPSIQTDVFAASGRFGLRLEQSDRSLHMQGLFEVKTDHDTAQIELYDPAGQRILLWRQSQDAEPLIETAKDGPSSAALVQDWLARRGIALKIDQFDAWAWRRWLELEHGRFLQGSLLIERSHDRLVIEQESGTRMRLVIVPVEGLNR